MQKQVTPSTAGTQVTRGLHIMHGHNRNANGSKAIYMVKAESNSKTTATKDRKQH
jgi:hypothetical protein